MPPLEELANRGRGRREKGEGEGERSGMMNVEEEIERLKEEIKRLGHIQPDGSYQVTFGVMFNDDRCANMFEALVGTLRAAKRRKLVTYDGELLLQGVHDNVVITLKPSPSETAVQASAEITTPTKK